MTYGLPGVRVMMITLVLFTSHGLAARFLSAQSVHRRLHGRVSPAVAAEVERIAADAQRKQLPIDGLVQKALEGGAKGVRADRIVAAVDALAGRLEIAARAVRTALPAESTPVIRASTIEAGAFALGAGLGEEEVVQLVRASRGAHRPAATLRVAGAVAALGVNAQQAVELVVGLIENGRPMDEINSLPASVQVGLSQGLSPSEAAGAAATRGHKGGKGRGAGEPGRGGDRGPDRPPKKQKDKPPRPSAPALPPGGSRTL